MVVEVEVGSEALPGFFHRTIAFEIHFLILHGSPETLREDVVEATAPAVHADFDTVLFQDFRELVARELGSLIAVEDFRLPAAERFTESFDAEFFFHRDRKPEGHHVAGIPVEDSREVCPAAGKTDERDIRSPDVIAFQDRHIPQQIRIFFVIGVWDGSLRPPINTAEAEFSHQRTDFLDADGKALADELHLHLPFSIEWAGGIDFIHRLEKVLILRSFNRFIVCR